MINNIQWYTIHDKHLGLRSEDNNTSISGTGASYAMDMGLVYKLENTAPPEGWQQLLIGTISTMQSFDNYQTRFLMIVSNSFGNSENCEYQGCFPKSSVKATTIKSVISLNNTIDSLVAWVESNI